MHATRVENLRADAKLQVIRFQESSLKWFTSRQNSEAVNWLTT
jgi:hypothetical protein